MNKAVAIVLVTVVATAVTLLSVMGASYEPQDQVNFQADTSKFMQRKLDFSSDIVEGLATENHEQIARAAQNLMVLSQEAEWNVLTNEQYLKASSDFRETVSRLREAGKQKNLDGATIAYFEVTINCVRCHRQLRQDPKMLLKTPTEPKK